MRTPTDAVEVVRKRLAAAWAPAAAGEEFTWNPRVPLLGTVTAAQLTADFPRYAAWAREWSAWAAEWGVELDWRTRRVGGTDQPLPHAVVVPDVDTAVRLAGHPWPETLTHAQARAAALRERFPHLAGGGLSGVVRTVTSWSDLDFELLCAAGSWFAVNDATGLTPRQVPIEGMHAKWLNTRRHLVSALSGRDDFGLAPGHPPRVHFTYLDPSHLTRGGRRHDSHTVGDAVTLPYPVRVVVICENKDTVVAFEPVTGGVAIEGNGRGGAAIAALEWVRQAEQVAYWGDMDADGLEILAEFRAAGVRARSLLMDVDAYGFWSRFGTRHDRFGQELQGRPARELPELTHAERELYTQLCDAAFTGPRRVEQERIPLSVAHAALIELVG